MIYQLRNFQGQDVEKKSVESAIEGTFVGVGRYANHKHFIGLIPDILK